MKTRELDTLLTNEYSYEPPIRIMTNHNHENDQWHIAEETNGRFAMLGIVAALGAYALTGQIIPGIF